ncbi:MAG: histidine phosphotransferase family protein [Hyphomonadaceae bacterium]
MREAPQMAAQVSAKVCHDLVEPMSAIIQGLDMLKEADNGKNAEALSLVESGVMKAWAKLDFYRFAFGGALADGEGEITEARDTAIKLFSQLKAELKWSVGAVAMPKAAVRVIMNLLYIANDCLPRGGTVEIASEGQEIRIVSQGQRAMLKPAVAAALRGETVEGAFPSQIIQPTFTGVLARLGGIELLAREAPERIELVARSAAFRPMSAAA